MDNLLTAVIADDEPLLNDALQRALQNLWPELSIVATAANGPSAINSIMHHQPDIAFLDIQMPGANGLEVAETIADEWPEGLGIRPPPLIVFVTAHDEYAVDAFKAAAIDYVLKPINSDRLKTTVTRLSERLQSNDETNFHQLGSQLRFLLESSRQNPEVNNQLRIIRASVGDMVRMIPIEEVILFESADKYVTVYTKDKEALIRESLRSLLPQLDSTRFAQIHRRSIVNMDNVEAAIRDETGRLTLRLRNLSRTPVVSRVYRHLFQAM